MRLDELKPGDTGTITQMMGEPALLQRLVEMGLLEGELVEFLARAPLGDPIEIRCGDSRLSLRRREAAGVLVDPLPAR